MVAFVIILPPTSSLATILWSKLA